MKGLLAAAAGVGAIMLTAACSSGSGGGGGVTASTTLPSSATKVQSTALIPVSSGPAGGQRVTHGPASLVITSAYTQRGDVVRQSKSSSVGYSSKQKSGSQAVTIQLAWSNGKDKMSAKQEAQVFQGQLLDVQHVKDLRTARVSWPGLQDAYQFTFTNNNLTPATKMFVVLGETSGGQFVSVTSSAPPALVDSQEVKQISGSLRVSNASGV